MKLSVAQRTERVSGAPDQSQVRILPDNFHWPAGFLQLREDVGAASATRALALKSNSVARSTYEAVVQP